LGVRGTHLTLDVSDSSRTWPPLEEEEGSPPPFTEADGMRGATGDEEAEIAEAPARSLFAP